MWKVEHSQSQTKVLKYVNSYLFFVTKPMSSYGRLILCYSVLSYLVKCPYYALKHRVVAKQLNFVKKKYVPCVQKFLAGNDCQHSSDNLPHPLIITHMHLCTVYSSFPNIQIKKIFCIEYYSIFCSVLNKVTELFIRACGNCIVVLWSLEGTVSFPVMLTVDELQLLSRMKSKWLSKKARSF